jgi:pyrroline-5-carboxylate reductase
MGITALFANEYVTMSALRKAENLLSPTGRTILLDNEDLMNAVTAVSGSGPAYFFFIAKNMIEAAKKMGLNDSHARLLVKQTMLGSYHLINQADQSLDSLISTVASKGGTTEAALTSFDNNQVGENIQLGLEQACVRALELSKAQ